MNLLKTTAILGLLLGAITPAIADTATQRVEHYNLKSGVAIQGYDPVAYFTQKKAVKGNAAHRYSHKKITYYFSSTKNLAKFKSAPARYEPQYGGWCAYAFAIDAGKVKINPERFKVIDGKLYLFYHTALGGNTLKKWNSVKNDKAQINKANSAWKQLVK